MESMTILLNLLNLFGCDLIRFFNDLSLRYLHHLTPLSVYWNLDFYFNLSFLFPGNSTMKFVQNLHSFFSQWLARYRQAVNKCIAARPVVCCIKLGNLITLHCLPQFCQSPDRIVHKVITHETRVAERLECAQTYKNILVDLKKSHCPVRTLYLNIETQIYN